MLALILPSIVVKLLGLPLKRFESEVFLQKSCISNTSVVWQITTTIGSYIMAFNQLTSATNRVPLYVYIYIPHMYVHTYRNRHYGTIFMYYLWSFR